ncbi:hypothetical protein PFISCL1PPCAC_25410 [Pristionchus fissidentatus]|uniref:TPM domain-containing protein n=1 Tax=Pristionchus fissidentatus TaxID=1538716 RepID=A0AAV5WS05_9BILA|nr:hypothetical protein PFISCL1PPCAC_25410 [Pristionchus fissidentatus]
MFLLLCLLPLAAAQFSAVNEIPNPRTNFRECKMRSIARVCDPTEILSEQDRYRLNTGLTNMQTKSSGQIGTFCQTKGVEGYFVAVHQADQAFADGLLEKWQPDSQCGKSVVIMLSKDNNQIHVGGAKKAGLNESDLSALIGSQQQLLQQGQIVQAIEGTMQGIAKMAAPPAPPPGTTDNRKIYQVPNQPSAGRPSSSIVPGSIVALLLTMLACLF